METDALRVGCERKAEAEEAEAEEAEEGWG